MWCDVYGMHADGSYTWLGVRLLPFHWMRRMYARDMLGIGSPNHLWRRAPENWAGIMLVPSSGGPAENFNRDGSESAG